MNNKVLLATIISVILIVGGLYFSGRLNNVNNTKEIAQNSGFGVGQEAIMYKSPSCGCCEGYASELEKQGFKVKIIPTDDMDSVKKEYNIPTDEQSCHTIALGNYFIEGHVPMKAVEKLVKEQPDINGIGLPGMPSGSPGMPGSKRAPYKVYQQLKNGKFLKFITI